MAQALIFFAISTAVSAAISYLFPSDGPRLKDLSVSASTYGNPIPDIYGTCRVGGNMIWASNIVEHSQEKKAGIGQYYNAYSYSVNMAMAFCRGPSQALRRIWANGKLIYDATGDSHTIDNNQFKFVFYNGGEDQMPDPTIAAAIGLPNTPAYRGLTYVVFYNFDLTTYFGNQIPQIAAEIYNGPEAAVGTIDLTTDGTTELTGYAAGEVPIVCDFTRGYYYTTRTTSPANTIIRGSLTTGIVDRIVQPALIASEDFYDGGNFSWLACVADDGSLIGTLGNKIVKIDPNSLQITRWSAHNTPFTVISGLDPGGWPNPPWQDSITLPLPFRVCVNTSGTQMLWASDGGSTVFLMNLDWIGTNTTTLSPICFYLGQFGGLGFNPAYGTAPNDTLGVAYIDPFGSPDTIIVQTWDSNGGVLPPAIITNPDGGSTSFTALMMCADNNTNSVIVAMTNSVSSYLTKVSLDDGSQIWLTRLPTDFPGSGYQAYGLQTNQIAYVWASKLYLMNTDDGTFINLSPDKGAYTNENWLSKQQVEYMNPGLNGYDLPANTADGYQVYGGQAGLLVSISTGGDTSRIIRVNDYGDSQVLLSDIVSDFLTQAGMLPDDYDVSDLASISVRGYGFAQTTEIKGILDELQRIFFFDLYERDRMLVAVRRGGAVAAETVSYKALGSSGRGGASSADFWKEKRLSEADLPASVNLKYLNIEQDFEENNAFSQRILAPVPVVFSRQQDTVEGSIVFDPTEAKNQANIMLQTSWAERTRHTTRLPPAYAYLEPSDLITVTMADGRSYFERIMHTDFGADYSTLTETAGQDSGAYTSFLQGDGGSGQGQTVNPPLPSVPFIINTPYLRDTDITGDGLYSIYYDGVGNMTANSFNGATLFQSLDEQAYSILGFFQHDVEYGPVSGIMPDSAQGDFSLDWKTRVTIYPAVDWFALQSITDDELMAGGNMCIVGNEVIQFRDCMQNIDGTWTIWNLLRGRRGTDYACANHVANETFMYLSTSTIGINQEPLDAGGKNFWYKAVSPGFDFPSAKVVEITYVPRDLMPYAPVQLSAAWSGADIQINFQRRTRWNGNLQDGTGTVPLNQATEAYQADIYDLSGNIIRTLSVDNGTVPVDFPFITYPAADVITDFTTEPTSLTVAVYQMGITGRGFGQKATLVISGAPSPVARYWGVSPLTALTEAEILALSGHDLDTDFDNSVTYNCAGGNYFYYAYPQTFGLPTNVLANGLPFSAFSPATVTVSGTSYYVLRSDTIQYGASIPVVWQ